MDNEKEAKAPFKERVAPACVSGCRGSHGAFWGPGGQEAAPQFTARTLRIWDKPHGAAGLRSPGTVLGGAVDVPREPPGAKRTPGEGRSLVTSDGGRAWRWRSERCPSVPCADRAQCIPRLSRPAPGARAARILLHQSSCGEQTINSGAKLKVRGRV